jgi:hypothetical protein
MRVNRIGLAVTSAISILALGAIFAIAQQRVSPHETVELMLNGKKVSITYGRPYLKGRQAVGGKLVPYDQVWRTGADEATKLTTETDLMIGNLSVPKGSYSLFTLPSQSGWKLIVNKTADQWGAFKYEATQDLGRADMQVKSLSAPVEQFTIKLAGSGKAGTLTLQWEKTEASIPITAK